MSQTSERKQVTVDTYNKSAKELAEYFRGIGSRVRDIDLAIRLSDKLDNPFVVEIGCGDGRDAKEIIKRTNNYIGFDISKELIKLAKKYVPKAYFEVADAINYKYPNNIDVVFAFASLLHLDKKEVKNVLEKVHTALRLGGIFYISLKLRTEYYEEIKEDKYGKRMFYYYNPEIITNLAGVGYEIVRNSKSSVDGSTSKWFEIALRKV